MRINSQNVGSVFLTKLRHHTAQDDNVLRLCRNGGIVFYKPNVIQLLQQAFLQLFAVWFQRNGSPVVRAENGVCFLCHGVVIGCDLIKQIAVRNDRIERFTVLSKVTCKEYPTDASLSESLWMRSIVSAL